AALGLLLWSGTAFAQGNVTFQVDMNTAITNCQFVPGTDNVFVRGTFNNFGDGTDGPLADYTLADDNGDGVYNGTFEVLAEDLNESGEIAYKYYAEPTALGWEDGADRPLAVPMDVDTGVQDFFKDGGISDQCTAVTYDLIFRVDMSVQIATGNFDPSTETVNVAGEFNGWSNAADELLPSAGNPEIYVGVVESSLASVGDSNPYKFIAPAPNGWESGDDRLYAITGEETDPDENGNPNVIVPIRFYNDVGPDQILTEESTVTFEVDLRPAFYFLADSSYVPGDTQTGADITEVTSLYINGPAAGAGDGLDDWATWGPDNLGAIMTRELVDDGTNGDRMAMDSVYTLQYTYAAGTPRRIIGKFGTDGYDNEGGFGADQNFDIDNGTNVISVTFGCVRQGDGTFTDQRGPSFVPGEDAAPRYDEYIEVAEDGSSCRAVRRGGAVAIEDLGGPLPTTALLEAAYPNPFARSTQIEYSVVAAGPVSLVVYDVTGRAVATLVDEVQAASNYIVEFDASELAAGVYVYQLRTGDALVSKQLTVVR
ncbi:MAG: T9SS type A sorting domain-containing protein, partial [Bacteroidota bacterium]